MSDIFCLVKNRPCYRDDCEPGKFCAMYDKPVTDTPADPIAAEARVFLEILTAGKPEAWTLSWNARKQLMDFMEKVAGMKSAGRAEAMVALDGVMRVLAEETKGRWNSITTPDEVVTAAALLCGIPEPEVDEWADFAMLRRRLAFAEQKLARCAEASAWRPITEASKDGTHILACDAHRPYDAAWTFDQRPPTVIHWFDGGEFEGWYTSVNELEPRSTFPATHFMPLPSAPEGGER